MPIGIVRVTSHQGEWESHSQGKGALVVDIQQPCGTRDAERQKGVGCRFLPLGDKMDRWRARVIRKRSRFVRLGATGKGLSYDGTSAVADTT